MAEPNFYKHYLKLVNLPDVSFLEARPEVRYFGLLRIWSSNTSVTPISYVKHMGNSNDVRSTFEIK